MVVDRNMKHFVRDEVLSWIFSVNVPNSLVDFLWFPFHYHFLQFSHFISVSLNHTGTKTPTLHLSPRIAYGMYMRLSHCKTNKHWRSWCTSV